MDFGKDEIIISEENIEKDDEICFRERIPSDKVFFEFGTFASLHQNYIREVNHMQAYRSTLDNQPQNSESKSTIQMIEEKLISNPQSFSDGADGTSEFFLSI